ncbi:hypothetical protein Lal_00021667 [Lupinus albus]|nr:hypothetical protein Lal_00021638 [Lupinus albus]KAF1860622.1 hypothetical protein Lal_00021667 [Lupinus albus]
MDLQNIDINIEDEDKAVLLVVSLPSTYKHFKEIMLYGNNDTLSFEDVKSNLLSKEKSDLVLPHCALSLTSGSFTPSVAEIYSASVLALQASLVSKSFKLGLQDIQAWPASFHFSIDSFAYKRGMKHLH